MVRILLETCCTALVTLTVLVKLVVVLELSWMLLFEAGRAALVAIVVEDGVG